MPTYEYKCKKCKREFEVTQRITDDALTECPFEDCDGEVFRKISKNIGLVFNGSGFYLTDYVHKHEKAPSTNGSGHKNGNGTSNKANGTETKNTAPKKEASA